MESDHTPPTTANRRETDELLAGLTDAQRQAVTTTEGPLLVVAAAGSGKTRVITRRIAYLVKQVGIPPWQILAITFTNKAAAEMRQRVAGLVTERQAQALTVRTFHSLCARLLREYAEAGDLPVDFSIYDTADQKRAIKQALADLDISKQNFPPDSMLNAISNAKNELQDPDAYEAGGRDFVTRNVARVYRQYQKILTKNQAVDFDDLLMKTAHLLRSHEAVRTELQDRFAYLLVDEYQDTNHAQFIIAHVLSAAHRNLCVVGDPDQSIYGWRGANIRNILEFEKHYPDATVIQLGQNYRSTPQILAVADHLIKHNRQRKHKPLFTRNPDGQKVRLLCAGDEEHEAQLVVDYLRDQHENHGMKWSDLAVFYRVNALSRAMEEALMRSSIPYQIARGTAFYQRKEVKDALAYLSVLMNPADEVALLRIINLPTRGIGKTSIERLRAEAANTGQTLWQTLTSPTGREAVTPAAAKAISRFVNLFENWRTKVATADESMMFTPAVRDVIEMIVRDSRLEDYYRKEDEEKADNLAELVTSAARFDQEYGQDDADLPQRLRDYLESVSLVSDLDGVEDASGSVTLMTLHAAKGLEFQAAAMIGVEEGLLPHSRSMDSPSEMEEERRLMFVGITRAQKRLMLSHARYRATRGYRERTVPSAFIRELPADHIEREDLSGYGDSPGRAAEMSFEPAFVEVGRTRQGRPRRGSAALPVGTQVRHPQFGQGSVIDVTGAGATARARIRFNTVGIKTLVLEYARLEKL